MWGERVGDVEVWFTKAKAPKAGNVKAVPIDSPRNSPSGIDVLGWRDGECRKLDDTRVEIQAFEEDFMIGVAAKEKSGPLEGAGKLPEVLTNFKSLHLEEEVMAIARQA
jgi:4'-phosphopantetheinyl transferase